LADQVLAECGVGGNARREAIVMLALASLFESVDLDRVFGARREASSCLTR
jgi:hypothetical protein